ncbi:MAG: L-2-amino-thiazoline-4-carboxylic acid hydrolase [Chloroflexales bacterium]|nr:L-2-amino-thiazoline-4-carboxylic acid hydrolase [Chloroflexales bacterium]
MLLRIAVDTLVFYRILPPDMSQETRLHLAQEFVNNWMDGQFDGWIARKVYANPFLHRLYRLRWFRSANKADEPDGQRFEIVEPKGNLFCGVNVTWCGVVKYLAQEGAPELARLIWRGDLHIQKYLPKNVEFRCSQVIAEGGQYCDFRYYFTDK